MFDSTLEISQTWVGTGLISEWQAFISSLRYPTPSRAHSILLATSTSLHYSSHDKSTTFPHTHVSTSPMQLPIECPANKNILTAADHGSSLWSKQRRWNNRRGRCPCWSSATYTTHSKAKTWPRNELPLSSNARLRLLASGSPPMPKIQSKSGSRANQSVKMAVTVSRYTTTPATSTIAAMLPTRRSLTTSSAPSVTAAVTRDWLVR